MDAHGPKTRIPPDANPHLFWNNETNTLCREGGHWSSIARRVNAGIINAGTTNDRHEKGTAMTATATATGPKTAAGKAVAARNATTHGLFCRQTVLPHLGEDPAGFQKLLDTLSEQLRPRNLMESQYLELWADASWKLRRLSRLEAQVWEDSLDEDARLAKLERLIRLQTSLRRQLDRAVRMLSQDVPNLFAHRTREDILAKLHLTETQCAENPYREQDVERAIQANRHWPAPAADFTDGLDNVDNATSPPDTPPVPHPLPSEERAAEGEGRRLADGERGSFDEEREAEACENKICQNEPVPRPHFLTLAGAFQGASA